MANAEFNVDFNGPGGNPLENVILYDEVYSGSSQELLDLNLPVVHFSDQQAENVNV